MTNTQLGWLYQIVSAYIMESVATRIATTCRLSG